MTQSARKSPAAPTARATARPTAHATVPPPESLVVVIEDDAAVRATLESLMRSVGQPCRAFASTAEFEAAELPDAPTCLVLDIRLPERSGLDFHRALAAGGEAPPTVFITGHGDVPMAVDAMKAGAIEFLAKPFRDQELLDAVQHGVRLDAERRARRASDAALHARVAILTPREREVMRMVSAGLANKQIAHELALSEITVKVHRAQMMRKLEVRTLPDLVRLADALEPTAPGEPGEPKP